MSKIKVWTPDGEWSNEVEGLDKIHLMKKAIRMASNFVEEIPDPFEGYEIDNGMISSDFEMKPSIPDFYFDFWRNFNHANGGDIISKATNFKLPLCDFKSLIKYDSLCAPLYNELLSAAKIPATASKDYCLLFKFVDE